MGEAREGLCIMKILKDFGYMQLVNPYLKAERKYIELDELRDEARKWIQWLDEHSTVEATMKEVKCSPEMYADAVDKSMLERAEIKQAHLLRMERTAVRRWIREFFFTEEERKQ